MKVRTRVFLTKYRLPRYNLYSWWWQCSVSSYYLTFPSNVWHFEHMLQDWLILKLRKKLNIGFSVRARVSFLGCGRLIIGSVLLSESDKGFCIEFEYKHFAAVLELRPEGSNWKLSLLERGERQSGREHQTLEGKH